MCENKASGASRRLTFKRMLSQPCISTIKSSSHLRIRQEGRSDMCVCVCVCACAGFTSSPKQNKVLDHTSTQIKKSLCAHHQRDSTTGPCFTGSGTGGAVLLTVYMPVSLLIPKAVLRVEQG